MEQKTFSLASELKEGYFFQRVCGEHGRIDFELGAVDGHWPRKLSLQLDVACAALDFSFGHMGICQMFPGNTVAGGWFDLPSPEDSLKGSFETAGRTAVLKIAGKTLSFTFAKPISPIGCMSVVLEGRGSFLDFTVSGLRRETSVNTGSIQAIDIAVDFGDDMVPAAWTPQMLKDYFRLFKDRGIRRVFWIYNGSPTDGVWENNRWPWRKNIQKTLKNFGSSFLRQAVIAAHQTGLEVIAVCKLFEGAWFSREAPEYIDEGKFHMIGGNLIAGYDFVAEHQECCFRHAPVQPAGTPRFLEIVHQGMSLKQKPELTLYTSADNRRYTPCPAAVQQVAANRWRFDLQGISAPFFAVANAGGVLVNAAKDIIRLYDDFGREIPATPGFTPRICRVQTENHLEDGVKQMDFREYGFLFDNSSNGSPVPSCIFVACAQKLHPVGLGGDIPAMAIAPGVNPQIPGALYPGEPAVGDFWRRIVEDVLAAGADGVGLRLTNHNSIFDWEQYGFNDEASSVADPAGRRRARGNAYTERVREISALIRRNGKKVFLYVPDVGLGSPENSTMMDVDWQWRRWIEENLADEIIFKLLTVDAPFTGWGQEVAEVCRKHMLPVAVEQFWQSMESPRQYLKDMAALGFTSFTIYEGATIWSANNDEKIVCIAENVNEVLRE